MNGETEEEQANSELLLLLLRLSGKEEEEATLQLKPAVEDKLRKKLIPLQACSRPKIVSLFWSKKNQRAVDPACKFPVQLHTHIRTEILFVIDSE